MGAATVAPTSARTNGRDGYVLLLLELRVFCEASGGDGERLLVAVDGSRTPVCFLRQGPDVFVVVLRELQPDSCWQVAQKQHGE